MEHGLNRGDFLKSVLAASGAGIAAPLFGDAEESGANVAPSVATAGPIASRPVLLNPAERSIDVAFALSGVDASGWVEIARSPDMAGAVRVHSGEGPLMDVNRLFATVRIRGLRPATRYWYRIGADRIQLVDEYKPRNCGSFADETVYSFQTLGASVNDGGFCVIQDTHAVPEVVDEVLAKVAELKPSVLVWNGDARNFYRTAANAVNVFLRPHPNHAEYAVETPVMFLNGNHDYRGRFALHLKDLVLWRELSERQPRYASLGRNFVQRIGDIALIGLDTGEDKLDTNPVTGGITRMKPYRELQTRWLAEEIEKPAVKTAAFKLALCHIPLYDPDPRENPGDVEPDDNDPRYKHPWAAWQRTCANMWGPLFDKAGVSLVCTGHQHRYRFDPPSSDRTWAHLIGGQRDVIHGYIKGGKLVVTVYDGHSRRMRREFVFP